MYLWKKITESDYWFSVPYVCRLLQCKWNTQHRQYVRAVIDFLCRMKYTARLPWSVRSKFLANQNSTCHKNIRYWCLANSECGSHLSVYPFFKCLLKSCQSFLVYIERIDFSYDHILIYSIQNYVKKFVSDLRQVCGFLEGTSVSSTYKTDRHDISKIFLKVALNAIPY